MVLWALSYTADGNLSGSLLYKIGSMIEPVTMWFGLRWQTFIAWIASAMGKEGALGVLAAVFSDSNVLHTIATQKAGSADAVSVGASLATALSKPEALAFIFAFYFNIPCLMTISSTAHETRSLKWTLCVAAYYIAVSLALAGIVYHLACLIF